MTAEIVAIHGGNMALLGNVAEDVFDEDIAARELTAYTEEPGHIMFVAVLDGLVVGQIRAIVHRHPDKAPELYVDNLGVDPSVQRRGIARRLMRAITDAGRERGCTEVWLGTEPDNEAANGLYKELGLKVQTMVMFEGKL